MTQTRSDGQMGRGGTIERRQAIGDKRRRSTGHLQALSSPHLSRGRSWSKVSLLVAWQPRGHPGLRSPAPAKACQLEGGHCSPTATFQTEIRNGNRV